MGAPQRVFTRGTGIDDAGYNKVQTGLSASLQANRILSIKRVLPKNTANRSTRVRPNHFNRLQRFCIDDLYVIDSCQVRFIDNPLRKRDDIVGRFFTRIFGRHAALCTGPRPASVLRGSNTGCASCTPGRLLPGQWARR